MMWSGSWVFIHVPRTGGTFLTDQFGHLPFVSKDVHKNKHAPARLARTLVGPHIWNTATKFYVYRSDEEILQSWYAHIQDSKNKITADSHKYASPGWIAYVKEVADYDLNQLRQDHRTPFLLKYVNKPDLVAFTLRQAYEFICEQTNYTPPERPRPFTVRSRHGVL